MRTADNNNLWHRSSSLETKKDSWSDNGIQAIVDIDAKTLIDSRVAKSLIAPYDKVNSQQKSAYNVQQLILYEIHESKRFSEYTLIFNDLQLIRSFYSFRFRCTSEPLLFESFFKRQPYQKIILCYKRFSLDYETHI